MESYMLPGYQYVIDHQNIGIQNLREKELQRQLRYSYLNYRVNPEGMFCMPLPYSIWDIKFYPLYLIGIGQLDVKHFITHVTCIIIFIQKITNVKYAIELYFEFLKLTSKCMLWIKKKNVPATMGKF